MRKYIIGCLVGFCLSVGVGAHAEVVTMINKLVEGTFPVTIDGKKLESDAVVIEGSTYLPVRAFGEAIGYKVGFDADLGVNLSRTVADAGNVEKKSTDTVKVNDGLPDTIEGLDANILFIKDRIKGIEDIQLKQLEKFVVTEPQNADVYKSKIIQYKEKISEYQIEIEKLENKKAELQK